LREEDLEDRAGADPALDAHAPRRPDGNAVHRRQAEARAFAVFLGREERLEEPALHLRRHAAPTCRRPTDHADPGVTAERRFASGTSSSTLPVAIVRVPASGHGIPCVQHQVHDDLLDLSAVGLDAPQRRPEIEHDRHVVADQALEHHPHVGDDGVEVDQRRRDDLLAAEGQQLAGQARGARAGFLNLGNVRPAVIFALAVGEQQLAEPQNHGQEIVEIMGDTARELSDGVQLLGLAELLLEGETFRDVERDPDAAHRLAALAEVDAARPAQPADLAIRAERAMLFGKVGAGVIRRRYRRDERRAIERVHVGDERLERTAEGARREAVRFEDAGPLESSAATSMSQIPTPAASSANRMRSSAPPGSAHASRFRSRARGRGAARSGRNIRSRDPAHLAGQGEQLLVVLGKGPSVLPTRQSQP
jgi:hypothetical protein